MMKEILNTSLMHLREGDTLLYPTDTIWGIGCDATCSKAIDRLYVIKERDPHKSMLLLCSGPSMVKRYVPSVTEEMLRLAVESARPTTVIFPQAVGLPGNLLAYDGSIGIRIPQIDFCQQLLKQLDRPIVSTSANLSGHPSPMVYQDIEQVVKDRVDYCVPNVSAFNQGPSRSSRIVKVTTDGEIITLRD